MKGAKNLLNRIHKLQDAIEKDAPKAIEDEVIERGVHAETGFAAAEYDGENDVTVDVNATGNNVWSITATGEKVLFIEYGTGIKFKHDSGFGSEGSFGPGQYGPKSWSLGPQGKKWLSEKSIQAHRGGWPYGGHFVYGNPSNNVMYNTSKALKRNLSGRASKAKKAIHEALTK